MNLKTKNGPSTPKHIQILARKTDDSGRTCYRVNWGSFAQNKISWEPITNLKDHYSTVYEYERKCQEKVQNWNQNVQGYQSCINHASQPQRNREEAKIENKEKDIIWNLENNEVIEPIISQPGNNQQQRNTLSDPTPHLTSQCIMNQVQQKNVSTLSQLSENKRICALLKSNKIMKSTFKSKITVNRTKRVQRREEQVKQQKLVQIKDIFMEAGVWYALVQFESIGQKQVLRDWIRLVEPQKLLLFYQKLVQSKKKDVNIDISHQKSKKMILSVLEKTPQTESLLDKQSLNQLNQNAQNQIDLADCLPLSKTLKKNQVQWNYSKTFDKNSLNMRRYRCKGCAKKYGSLYQIKVHSCKKGTLFNLQESFGSYNH